MSDAAPTTATATAAPTDGPSGADVAANPTQKPAAAPPSRPGTKPGVSATPERPRLNDGRFAPKDGNVAKPEVEPDAQPKETEAQKEARRFKGKAKVFGQEEEFDYGEDDLPRVHQRLRMLEKKEADFRKGKAELEQETERFFRLAKDNPVAFLKEAGHDPIALARKQLAEQARLGAMDDNERALFERDRRIAELEATQKQQAEAEKAFRQKALRQHINQRQEQLFLGALQSAGLPPSSDSLRVVLETYEAMMEDFGPEAAATFSPEELAQETNRRLSEYTDRFLNTLDGPGLRKRLGPKRVQAIIQAELADFQASQPTYEAPPQPVVESSAPESDGPMTMDEVRERLQKFGR